MSDAENPKNGVQMVVFLTEVLKGQFFDLVNYKFKFAKILTA